jgi:hypothetical protein
MTTEVVFARMVPMVEAVIKEVLRQVAEQATPPTRYALEELTQALLPRRGQVLVQELVTGQGRGVRGSARPCAWGGRASLS